MILDCYEMNKKQMWKIIEQDAISIAVTTDGWTSIKQDKFWTVTGHFLTSDFKPMTVCLNVIELSGTHSADRIDDMVLQPIVDQCKTPILCAITDNGSNAIAAITVSNIPNRLPCAAHSLQLCIKGFMMKFFEDLITKLKSIVKHFSKSAAAVEQLTSLQLSLKEYEGKTPLRLVKDVKTRWNSTFSMIGKNMFNES